MFSLGVWCVSNIYHIDTKVFCFKINTTLINNTFQIIYTSNGSIANTFNATNDLKIVGDLSSHHSEPFFQCTKTKKVMQPADSIFEKNMIVC